MCSESTDIEHSQTFYQEKRLPKSDMPMRSHNYIWNKNWLQDIN